MKNTITDVYNSVELSKLWTNNITDFSIIPSNSKNIIILIRTKIIGGEKT